VENLRFEYNVNGAALSTMKAGGKVKRVCRPADIQGFVAALNTVEEPFMVLGNGSNVVFTSAGYEGTVILTTALTEISDTPAGIICGAGVSLSAVASRAAERGLSGMEFAYGIPGTVGGAVYMNAGAYGGEIKDVLKSVLCARKDGSLVTLSGEDACLSYRHSVFMEQPLYILRAEFVFTEGNADDIRAQMAQNMARRREKQPLEYPSCGSTFKRPTGYYAGALIEQCGLKGLSVGGAQVSEKHAGFVINRGDAKGDDVVALIRKVQQAVLKETGVMLETEVKII